MFLIGRRQRLGKKKIFVHQANWRSDNTYCLALTLSKYDGFAKSMLAMLTRKFRILEELKNYNESTTRLVWSILIFFENY